MNSAFSPNPDESVIDLYNVSSLNAFSSSFEWLCMFLMRIFSVVSMAIMLFIGVLDDLGVAAKNIVNVSLLSRRTLSQDSFHQFVPCNERNYYITIILLINA